MKENLLEQLEEVVPLRNSKQAVELTSPSLTDRCCAKSVRSDSS